MRTRRRLASTMFPLHTSDDPAVKEVQEDQEVKVSHLEEVIRKEEWVDQISSTIEDQVQQALVDHQDSYHERALQSTFHLI